MPGRSRCIQLGTSPIRKKRKEPQLHTCNVPYTVLNALCMNSLDPYNNAIDVYVNIPILQTGK